MPTNNYTPNYLTYNAESTKLLVIAVEIEGLNTILTSSNLFTRVRYGDPGLEYGQAGLVYGGLIPYGGNSNLPQNQFPLGGFQSILDTQKGSYTLQQKIEPEQGRSSVSMLTLTFIDYKQYMTKLISPGVILDDILGKEVKVYLGFQDISFPEDYSLIFRGRVSTVTSTAGSVELQLSDPNIARRQQIFYTAKGYTQNLVAPGDTTIPLQVLSGGNVSNFFTQVLGPSGTYDPAITTYLKIENEFIEYPYNGIDVPNNQFINCVRGARGTTPAAHNAGTEVDACIQINDHAINMALKIMLSGWQGPYMTGQALQGFVVSNDPIVGNNTNAIILPGGTDAIRDLGIAPGDYVYVTGATNSANNVSAVVNSFLSTEEGFNQVLVTNTAFTAEGTTSAVMSVRSQYDTYPDLCGLQMPGYEVDVAQHQYIYNTFLSSSENYYNFFIQAAEDVAKTFIESEIYFPISCYSLTRFGRMSMQLTHSPLSTQTLQFLTASNVLNPDQISPSRGVNSRKFYNQIQWSYDFNDAGNAVSILEAIDTNSLNVIGLASLLPINALGIKSSITSQTTINQRTDFLLSRYKDAALMLSLDTNFGTGSLIEAGDVVAVTDGGQLQISNFLTGQRNLGTQLFEVVDRSLDLVTGKTTLQLVSGITNTISDRYGVISPASMITASSTSNVLYLQDSFYTTTPGQEGSKWTNILGNRGLLHTTDWTTAATCNLISFPSTNPNAINVSGLGITPSAGMTLDVDYYPNNTNVYDQAVVKAQFCSFDLQTIATSGISNTAFQVAASAIPYFDVGDVVLVHDYYYTYNSGEIAVSAIDSINNIVYLKTSMGFTPTAGNYIDELSFLDGSGPYRDI